MCTPDHRWLLATTGASITLPGLPLPSRQDAPIALRGPVWPALAAALMAFCLLLAFQQVVAQGVEQGTQRRMAAAAHLEGTWRCKLLREPGDRGRCLAQLDGAQDPPSLRSRNAPAAVAAVHNQPRGHRDIVPVHTLVKSMEK
jgi:hypothetical protein